jgi:hypothetical protein
MDKTILKAAQETTESVKTKLMAKFKETEVKKAEPVAEAGPATEAKPVVVHEVARVIEDVPAVAPECLAHEPPFMQPVMAVANDRVTEDEPNSVPEAPRITEDEPPKVIGIAEPITKDESVTEDEPTTVVAPDMKGHGFHVDPGVKAYSVEKAIAGIQTTENVSTVELKMVESVEVVSKVSVKTEVKRVVKKN